MIEQQQSNSSKNNQNQQISDQESNNEDTLKQPQNMLKKIESCTSIKTNSSVAKNDNKSFNSGRNSLNNTNINNNNNSNELDMQQLPLLFDLKNLFKKEQSKINTWTKLFKKLNKSISNLFYMCEIENQVEFCTGVADTLQQAQEDFQKLIKKMNIEDQDENVKRKKAIAWELSSQQAYDNMANIQLEAENIYNDLEDPEKIDFTLFAQLITEKKMSVQESIVLLVRESAIALNENNSQIFSKNQKKIQNLPNNNIQICSTCLQQQQAQSEKQQQNQQNNFISNNNSFISKFSDFFDVIKDIQDENEQSIQGFNNDSVLQQSNSNVQTMTQINNSKYITLEQLFKRMNYKYNNQNNNNSTIVENENEEDIKIKKQYEEKLLKAQQIRINIENLKKDAIIQKKEKKDQIKKKNDEEIQNKRKNFEQKINLANQRQKDNLNQKKLKAKNENDKANEIAFINMLQNKSKKLSYDDKLRETMQRRQKILENIQQKQQKRAIKEEQIEKKRQEKTKEQQQKANKSLQKQEFADFRRSQLMQEEIRKQNNQLNRIKQVKQKKQNAISLTKDKDQKNFKDKLNIKLLNDKKLIDRIFINKKINFQNNKFKISNSNNFTQQIEQNNESVIESLSELETLNSDWESSGEYEDQQYFKDYSKFQYASANNSAEVSFFEDDFDYDNDILFYYPRNKNKNGSKDKNNKDNNEQQNNQNNLEKEIQSISQIKKDDSTKKINKKKMKIKMQKKLEKVQQEYKKKLQENEFYLKSIRTSNSLPPLEIKKGQFQLQQKSGKSKIHKINKSLKQKKNYLKQIRKDYCNENEDYLQKDNITSIVQIKNQTLYNQFFQNEKENKDIDQNTNSSKVSNKKSQIFIGKSQKTPTKLIQSQINSSVGQPKGKLLFKQSKSENQENQENNNNSNSLNQSNKNNQLMQIDVQNNCSFIENLTKEKQDLQSQSQQLIKNIIITQKQNDQENKSQQQQLSDTQNQDINSNLKKKNLEDLNLTQQQQQKINPNKYIRQQSFSSQSQSQQSQQQQQQQFRWCSVCNQILQEDITDKDHIDSKQHKKSNNLYQLKEGDDKNCILSFLNIQDLTNERFQSLRKRSKNIKKRMNVKGFKHENANIVGKETSSINRNRIQKLCLDLEKLSNQQLINYEAMENSFKDMQKVLDQRRESDLHVLRQIRFIPILMDIFKKVSICQKNEINDLMKILEVSSKVLQSFCGQIDNRTYMILTNRAIQIIELLNWALNRPTKFVYSLNFVPVLFTVLIMLLKHRIPVENQEIKEGIFEFLFFSGFILKIKQKFMSFYEGIDLSIGKGKVPLALIKSVALLESISNFYSIGILKNEIRHEENKSAPETIIFVLKETDLCGIINLVAATILKEGDISKNPKRIIPQTFISLTMIAIKFLNNIARISVDLLQSTMVSSTFNDTVYHIFTFLLTYCNENYEHSEDVKDLLNELILLIGYFALMNSKTQEILCKGSKTIVQKLLELPNGFFFEKNLKQILFPTLIILAYRNERCCKIILQDINTDLLLNWIKGQQEYYNMVEDRFSREIQKMLEEQEEKMKEGGQNENDFEQLCFQNSQHTQMFQKSMFKGIFDTSFWQDQGSSKIRSVSISSTCSSQNSNLYTSSNNQFFLFPARFPIQLWGDAYKWIQKIESQL